MNDASGRLGVGRATGMRRRRAGDDLLDGPWLGELFDCDAGLDASVRAIRESQLDVAEPDFLQLDRKSVV